MTRRLLMLRRKVRSTPTIYFLSFNMRVLLSVGVDANDQNLLQRGALLYCVRLSECGPLFQKPLRARSRNRLNLHEGKSDAWVFRNHLILEHNPAANRKLSSDDIC